MLLYMIMSKFLCVFGIVHVDELGRLDFCSKGRVLKRSRCTVGVCIRSKVLLYLIFECYGRVARVVDREIM